MSYFNEAYYLRQNPDVQSAIAAHLVTSALQHYQLFGATEQRNPSSNFNAAYYLSANPDVRAAVSSGVFRNALEHFDLYGVQENRAPTSAFASFNGARYLTENPDVQAAVTARSFMSALDHYLQFGAAEGRPAYTAAGAALTATNTTGSVPYFNENYYLDQNPDVRAAVEQGFYASGLQHYQLSGGQELRSPSANFDAVYYVAANSDVRLAVNQGVFRTPLEHFDQFGVTENRAPNAAVASFDAARYLADYPDVQAAVSTGVFKSALDHYLQFGSAESRPAYTTIGTTLIGPGDTFVLTSRTVSVNEGGTVTFTLQAQHVLAGAEYNYTITGVSAADVQGGSLTGTVTIDANGRALIPVTLVADSITEGAETMTVTIAGRSKSVIVNDTSLLPVATLTAGVTSVDEGSVVTFTLQTVNVAAGALYTYTLSGVSAADIQGGSLTGTVTIGANGQALIPVILRTDLATEGAESLTVTVAGLSTTVTVNDTSRTPLVPVQTFSLTPSGASVNEGGTAVFTLQTSNVATGTQFAYTITGISAADIQGGLLTGTATIDSNGQALISRTLLNDVISEAAETMTLSIAGQVSTITVNDTSVGFLLTLAVDNFAGGAGTDNFTGTYSNGGGETFNGDTLAGGGGTDTLTLTVGAEAIIVADSVWTNVSGIENVVLDTNGGSGSQTLTTGANFNTAFTANGINLTEKTLLGAITLDMTGFTGAATIATTTIGAGAHTITTGSGAATVAATSTVAGAQTITGTGLTTVTGTINGAGDQIIGNTGLTNNLTSVTATIVGAGNQTITSTSSSAVTVTATAAAGTQTITTAGGNDSITSSAAAGQSTTISTGAGNDTIVAGASLDLITGGTGADTMTGGGAVDTFAFGTNGSIIGTSMDIITDFNTGGADRLTFGASTAVLGADATALVAGSGPGANVQQTAGGLIIFHASDNTLALKTAAVQADVELDAVGTVAMFVDGGNTYVYYAGGASGNVDDQLIQLTGLTTLATITGGAQTTFA